MVNLPSTEANASTFGAVFFTGLVSYFTVEVGGGGVIFSAGGSGVGTSGIGSSSAVTVSSTFLSQSRRESTEISAMALEEILK